jgi:hypothetical protein
LQKVRRGLLIFNPITRISSSFAFAGTTYFACVKGAGAHNTNVDCTPGGPNEGFGHLALAPNDATTVVHRKLTNPKLVTKLFGANIELEATGLECEGCSLENKEVGGVMEATGTGKLRFSGVKVVGLESKCTVVGVSTGVVVTKALRFTTTSVAGMTLEPESETLLAVFNITGGECVVAGTGLQVTGKAFVEAMGATVIVNVTKASAELLLEGEKASLKGEGTIEGSLGNPFSLTPA